MKDENKEINVNFQQDTPKAPKRFRTYQEAFDYYLEIINFDLIYTPLHKNTKDYKAQRKIIYQIVLDSIKKDKNIISQSDITKDMIKEVLNWDLIDKYLRQIIDKNSSLSRHQRTYLLDLFQWVDHFVAKNGEEITKN